MFGVLNLFHFNFCILVMLHLSVCACFLLDIKWDFLLSSWTSLGQIALLQKCSQALLGEFQRTSPHGIPRLLGRSTSVAL